MFCVILNTEMPSIPAPCNLLSKHKLLVDSIFAELIKIHVRFDKLIFQLWYICRGNRFWFFRVTWSGCWGRGVRLQPKFSMNLYKTKSSQGWFGLEGSLKVISFQPPLPALSDCYCSHQKVMCCCHRVTIVLWGNTFNTSKVTSSYSTPTSEPLQIFINSVELEERTSKCLKRKSRSGWPWS